MKIKHQMVSILILFIGIDSINSNSLESFTDKYREICDSLTISCQLDTKSTLYSPRSTTTLSQKINEYLEIVEGMKSNLIEVQKYSFAPSVGNLHVTNNVFNEDVILIRSGQFGFAQKKFAQFGDIYLINLIVAVYYKEMVNAQIVFDFLNSFSDSKYIILGYRVLFDEMIKNQNIESILTTTIAYRVFTDFNQTYNENIAHLRTNLPDSLKQFNWNQAINIVNVKLNSTIYLQNSYIHDPLRSIPIAVPRENTANTLTGLHLIPVSNGTYFHIQSKYFNDYLYAETDEFAFNSEQRGVFVWMNKKEARESGKWQLEPIIGSLYFKIKNVYWNEYLTIKEGLLYNANNKHYKLFTLKSGRCDNELCLWKVLKYTGN